MSFLHTRISWIICIIVDQNELQVVQTNAMENWTIGDVNHGDLQIIGISTSATAMGQSPCEDMMTRKFI